MLIKCFILFRRDSFITHRAFCDALAAETGKQQPVIDTSSLGEDLMPQNVDSLPPSSPTPPTSTAEIPAVFPNHSSGKITKFVFSGVVGV